MDCRCGTIAVRSTLLEAVPALVLEDLKPYHPQRDEDHCWNGRILQVRRVVHGGQPEPPKNSRRRASEAGVHPEPKETGQLKRREAVCELETAVGRIPLLVPLRYVREHPVLVDRGSGRDGRRVAGLLVDTPLRPRRRRRFAAPVHKAWHPAAALAAVVVTAEDDLRHGGAAIFRLDADEVVVDVLSREVNVVLVAFRFGADRAAPCLLELETGQLDQLPGGRGKG